MPTKIIKCYCTNKFQDQRYGPNNRVANAMVNKSRTVTGYKCTVCAKQVK